MKGCVRGRDEGITLGNYDCFSVQILTASSPILYTVVFYFVTFYHSIESGILDFKVLQVSLCISPRTSEVRQLRYAILG